MIGLISSIKNVVAQLNYILTRTQKKRALCTFGVTVLCSFVELLGVTAILPFLELLVAPDEFVQTPIMGFILEKIAVNSQDALIIIAALGIVVVYLLKNAIIIWATYLQYGFSAYVKLELSVKMLKSYMARPYTYFLNVNSGEILRGCTTDVGCIYTIIAACFVIISEVLSTILIGLYIFYTEPVVAICVVGLLILVGLGIVFILKPIMKRIGKENLKVCTSRNKAIYQCIMGIKEIFVTQRKEFFTYEYELASSEAAKIERLNSFLSSIPDRIIEGICISGLIIIVVIRVIIGDDTLAFIPRLGTFAVAAFKILPSMGKITGRVNDVVYAGPALQNVYDVIVEANKYDEEKPHNIIETVTKRCDNNEGFSFEGSLSINNIEWRYPGGSENVLKQLSITISKGESVGIIGASGAGKTTLVDTILGLLKPQKGNIVVDGIDVFSEPHRWAKTIGYVPQQVFLIDDTIRNNITFGISDYTEEEVWDAIDRAQLREFVEKLDDKLDTYVGERGVRLSGGQRQRIAIARALFAKPQILVLDEATSALDNETENAVMEAVETLQGYITMIIVAHRLTTISNCDKIYEIYDGKAISRSKIEVFS